MNTLFEFLLAWFLGSVPIAAALCFLIDQGKKHDRAHRDLCNRMQGIQWPVSHEIQ